MKSRKLGLFIIAIVLGIMIVTGCTTENNLKKEDNNENKLVVYASIYPIYDFAKEIGGDKIDLRLMIPPGIEPHDWEPSGKLMGELEKADLFIYNGVGMEPWAEKLHDAIGGKVVSVEASKGVELLKLDDDHNTYDPHIWLNPLNAMKEAENIKDAIVAADYQNKEFYEKNFKDFSQKLISLDEKFGGELGSFKKREIVVSHAAFGYLAKRYGLVQIAIKGLSPEEEPSAGKMAEITDFARNHQIKYIFFETLSSPKIAAVLAKEAGTKTAVLNPIGGLTTEEMKDGKNYISVMEENLEILKKALGE